MGSKTDLRVNISQSLCYTSLLLKCLLSKILKVIWCFKQEQKKEYVHLWKRTWENSIICIKEPLVTFYSFLIWNIWRLSPKDFKWGSIPFHDSSSVQFSRSVVSYSLRPHESQHTRPPCPSPTPGVHSDSRPSSQWCHPAISSWVIPFSCPQSLPASESFPMSQLFAWGGQSTGASALASFLPKKSQGWSPSEWTGWIYIFILLEVLQQSLPIVEN